MSAKIFENSTFPRGMSRAQAIILYVVHTIDDLKNDGLLEGGQIRVAKEGETVWKELEALGFKPTTEELHACLIELSAAGFI
jgi:hypothetical protein